MSITQSHNIPAVFKISGSYASFNKDCFVKAKPGTLNKHGLQTDTLLRQKYKTFLTHEVQVRYQETEKYSKSSQTSKMELSAKIVNRFKPLAVFAKSSILDDS